MTAADLYRTSDEDHGWHSAPMDEEDNVDELLETRDTGCRYFVLVNLSIWYRSVISVKALCHPWPSNELAMQRCDRG